MEVSALHHMFPAAGYQEEVKADGQKGRSRILWEKNTKKTTI